MEEANDSREQLKHLLEQINKTDISSISQIIAQLMNIINDPKSGAVDLKNVIEKDPPLTARLLKLANSAFYNYARTVDNIRDAIVLIGFNAVKELAMSQKVCELFADDKLIHGYSRPSLWKHSVAVALCNKHICRKAFRESGENAYVGGLIHDIGMIIEDQFMQDRFIKILEDSLNSRINFYVAEEKELKFDHSFIACELAKIWSFPIELAEAIGKHHAPQNAEKGFRKYTYVLYVSDYACQEESIGYGDVQFRNRQIYRMLLKKLKIKEDGMKLIMKEVKEEIRKMEKAGWF